MELPDLVSALNARVGAVLRLGVDARDWDDIPRRITVGGHMVRIGRYAHVNHKIIATRGPPGSHHVLVVPPHASTAAAKSALARAATGRNSGRPEEILTAAGIQDETKANPPRAAIEAGRPLVTEYARPDEIGRWLDDGAPSPSLPVRQPS